MTAKEQQEALEATMHQQLRALYMSKLGDKEAAGIITAKQELSEQLELLVLCNGAKQEKVLAAIGGMTAKQLRAGRLLLVTSSNKNRSLKDI